MSEGIDLISFCHVGLELLIRIIDFNKLQIQFNIKFYHRTRGLDLKFETI